MFRMKISRRLNSIHGRLASLRNKPAQSTNAVRQHWSIGIYSGDSPLRLHAPEGFQNPVLNYRDVSDVDGKLVADPFMVRTEGRWHMFFEVETAGRGQIGWATSDDAVRWAYGRIVLSEPFHLSYPYVFEWQGDYFMVPESFQADSVRLYKATRFPEEWSFQRTLLEGSPLLDPSLLRYNGKWWMFVETNPQHKYDTLRLFYANELTGPWQEHPRSPVVEGNNRKARPAGRVQVIDGRPVRFAQDCYPRYGTRVRAFAISELSTRAYRESECPESPILGPSGTGWNELGMHHVDPHKVADGKWIACVDGVVLKPIEVQASIVRSAERA
jgi:hypothetical protein